MTTWSKGANKSLVRIIEPPKESGVSSLKIGNEMWNYFPNMKRVIKVSPAMQDQSWMGSDFSNDDMLKISNIVDDYEHKLISTVKLKDGTQAYKVESIPKPEAPVVWGKIMYWARKGDCLPLRQEYYDEKGKLIKVLDILKVEVVKDKKMPTKLKMETITKEGAHHTIITYLDVDFDISIDDNMFTTRYLSKEQ